MFMLSLVLPLFLANANAGVVENQVAHFFYEAKLSTSTPWRNNLEQYLLKDPSFKEAVTAPWVTSVERDNRVWSVVNREIENRVLLTLENVQTVDSRNLEMFLNYVYFKEVFKVGELSERSSFKNRVDSKVSAYFSLHPTEMTLASLEKMPAWEVHFRIHALGYEVANFYFDELFTAYGEENPVLQKIYVNYLSEYASREPVKYKSIFSDFFRYYPRGWNLKDIDKNFIDVIERLRVKPLSPEILGVLSLLPPSAPDPIKLLVEATQLDLPQSAFVDIRDLCYFEIFGRDTVNRTFSTVIGDFERNYAPISLGENQDPFVKRFLKVFAKRFQMYRQTGLGILGDSFFLRLARENPILALELKSRYFFQEFFPAILSLSEYVPRVSKENISPLLDYFFEGASSDEVLKFESLVLKARPFTVLGLKDALIPHLDPHSELALRLQLEDRFSSEDQLLEKFRADPTLKQVAKRYLSIIGTHPIQALKTTSSAYPLFSNRVLRSLFEDSPTELSLQSQRIYQHFELREVGHVDFTPDMRLTYLKRKQSLFIFLTELGQKSEQNASNLSQLLNEYELYSDQIKDRDDLEALFENIEQLRNEPLAKTASYASRIEALSKKINESFKMAPSDTELLRVEYEKSCRDVLLGKS